MRSLSKLVRAAVLALALPLLAGTVQAVDLDKLAPADAEAVVVLNFKNFMESALFQKYGDEAVKQALKNEQVVEFIKKTGLEPTKDIHSMTVTFTGISEGATEPKACVIVKGNFDVDKLQTLITTEAKKTGELVKITEEDKLTFYTVTNPQDESKSVTGTFKDKESLVISNDIDYLKKIVGGGAKDFTATKAAKQLRAGLKKVGGKETVFAAFAVNDKIKEAAGALPQYADLVAKLESVVGTVNVADAVDLTVTINASDKETAKGLVATIKDALPALKFLAEGIEDERMRLGANLLANNLRVSTEGLQVVFKLQLTDDQMTVARNMGQGYRMLRNRRWEDAEKAFNEALKIEPENKSAKEGVVRAKVGPALSAGNAALQAKMWAEAEKAFNDVLKLDPENAEAKDGIQKAKDKK